MVSCFLLMQSQSFVLVNERMVEWMDGWITHFTAQ